MTFNGVRCPLKVKLTLAFLPPFLPVSPERESVSYEELRGHARSSSPSDLAITQASQWRAGESRRFLFPLTNSQACHLESGAVLQGPASSRLPGPVICPHLRRLCEMVTRYVCICRLGVGSAVTAPAPARRRRGRGRGRPRKARETAEITPPPAPNKVTCGKPTLPSSLSLSFSPSRTSCLSLTPFCSCPHSPLRHPSQSRFNQPTYREQQLQTFLFPLSDFLAICTLL